MCENDFIKITNFFLDNIIENIKVQTKGIRIYLQKHIPNKYFLTTICT